MSNNNEKIDIVFDEEKLEAYLKEQEEMDKQIFEHLKTAFPILFEGDEEDNGFEMTVVKEK